MKNNHIKTSGAVGMASTVLWLIALTIEYKFQLFPPGDGSGLYFVDQVMFLVAMAGYLFMLTGLWQSKAAGEGRFGKISLGIFITAISAWVIGIAIGLIYDLDPYLLPIGGILQLFGGLLTGIAVITAKKMERLAAIRPNTPRSVLPLPIHIIGRVQSGTHTVSRRNMAGGLVYHQPCSFHKLSELFLEAQHAVPLRRT